MSTSVNRQSKRRKREDVPSTEANKVFHRDSADPAPPLPPRDSKLHRSFRRRLQSQKEEPTSSNNADSDQVASVSRDSERKKGFKKSITGLPKLFTRLLRLDSKSDNESTSTSDSECSAPVTLKSKSSHWTKFMMRLTKNRTSSTSQQSESPASNVSFPHSSPNSNLEPSTHQVDRTSSSKPSQLPTSRPAKEDYAPHLNREPVAGSVRKIRRGRAIPTSDPTGAVPDAFRPSAFPRAINDIDYQLPVGMYSRKRPISIKLQPRTSSENAIKIRSLESTLNSDIKPSLTKRIDRFKNKRAPQSYSVNSSQIASSTSKSNPFGDIQPISVPVMEPILAKRPSWQNIQSKFPKKVFHRQFSQMEISYSRNKISVDKNLLESTGNLSLPCSPSYLSGDVRSSFFSELEPIQVQTPSSLNATANFGVDGTRKKDPPDSFSRPQFRKSSRHDQKMYRPSCHPMSTPVTRESYLRASSSHTFSQPASTQILKPVQSKEVSTHVNPLPRSLQQISDRKSSNLSSYRTSRDPNTDVKLCPESAQVELGHLKITNSSLSADSSGAVQSVSPSELDSECAGHASTSTRRLSQKKMLEMISGTSSRNALTSVLSSPRHLTSYSSTSCSDNPMGLVEQTKAGRSPTKISIYVNEPGNSGKIIEKYTKVEASKPYSVKRERSPGSISSTLSSSSTIFKNSTERINSTFGLKKESVSLMNLLQADSTTSDSIGSDAGNSSDLRKTSAEGQIEFVASNPLAADNENTRRDSSPLIHQQSIRKKKRKTSGKRRFFGKVMSAFSTSDKNEYEELLETESDPPVPEIKKSVRGSKKKAKD